MELNLKAKSAQIVLFTIGGLLIIFLLLSLITRGKEAGDILQKNYYPANTINVAGEGKIMAMPDIAYMGYDIETKNKDLKVAMEKNKETIKSFSSFLAEQGIKQDEIWVTNFNVMKNTLDAEGKESITYQLTNTIKVKIKDKEKLAEKIKTISDKAIQNGMIFNNTGGYGYCNSESSEVDKNGLFVDNVDNQEKYITEGMEKALEGAKKRAKQQVEMAGLQLGDIVNISDYSDFPSFCTAFVADFINPIEVKKSMSVTFEVKR